jgi:hypothetical protein
MAFDGHDAVLDEFPGFLDEFPGFSQISGFLTIEKTNFDCRT